MTEQYIVFRFKKDDIDENEDFSNAEVLYVLSGDELPHIDDNKITIDNINIFDNEKNMPTDSVNLKNTDYYYVIIDSKKNNEGDTIYIFESMKITGNDITTSNKILKKTMQEFFGESNVIGVSNTINGIIKGLNEQGDRAKDYYTDFYKSKKQVSIAAGGGQTDTNENNSDETINEVIVKNLFNTYYNTVQEISNIPLLKKLTSLDKDSLESIGINNPKDFINKILYLSEIDFSPFFNATNSEHKKSLLFLFGMDLSSKDKITIDNKFLNDNLPDHNKTEDVKLPDHNKTEDVKFTIKRIPFATMLYHLNDNKYINNQNYDNKSLQFLIHFLQKIINDDITILTNILDKYDKDIHKEEKNKISINTAIRQKMKNNILTFLKFRNDDHGKDTYNRRFNIEIGGTQSTTTDKKEKLKKILKIGYNNDNVKYYEKKTDGNIQVSNVDDDHSLYKKKGTEYINPKSRYPYNYLFGEFTQIFTPDLNNQQVAEKMNILVENYTSDKPKPVFIIGYGASGAGKTSTLIHFTNPNPKGHDQPGILTEFCNLEKIRKEYSEIQISYKEFYQKTNDNNNDNNNDKTSIETVDGKSEDGKSETLTFKVNEGKDRFTLSAQQKHPIHHRYRVKKLKDEQSDQCKKLKDEQSDQCKNIHDFDADSELGSVVNYLIDTDRHVKATTNNPNSSRSHCLVFVKMIRKDTTNGNGKGNGYLIVGDFAGVENRFDCENPNVLADFMNIKKPGKDELFYEDEKCCDGEIDPIGPVDLCKSGKNKNTGDDSNDNGNVSDPEIYDVSESDEEDDNDADEAAPAPAKKAPRELDLTRIPTSTMKPTRRKEPTQNGGAISNIDTSNVNKLPVYNSEDTEVDRQIKVEYNKIFNKSITSIGEKYRKLLQLLVGKNKIDVKDVGKDDVETYVETHIHTQWDQAKIYYDDINDQIKENEDIIKFEKTKKTLFTETKIPSLGNVENMSSLKILKQDTDIEKIVKYINTYNIMLSKFVRDKQTDKKIYKFILLSNDYVSIQNKTYTYTNDKNINGDYLPEDQSKKDEIINKLSNYLDLKDIEFPIYLESNLTITKIKNIEKKDIPNPKLNIKVNSSNKNKATKEMNNTISRLQPIDLSKDITDQLKNNKFTTTYKELFENDNIEEFVAFVRDMEYNRLQKEKVGDVVCTNRRVEGEYINDSLRELRDEIKHIMTIKNKDALSVMPNYIDICFDQYCPDHKDCFGFDSQITKDTIPPKASASNASIMGAVHEFLKGSGYGEEQKINKDILISIFCVFNISRMANNPPPVPYVDINKLKRLYYYGDIFDKDVNEFVEEGNELINTLQEEYKDTYIDEGATEQKQKDLADNYEKQMREEALSDVSNVIDKIMADLRTITSKRTYLDGLFGDKETSTLRNKLSTFYKKDTGYDEDYYNKVQTELNDRKDEMKELLNKNEKGQNLLTQIVDKYKEENGKRPKAETVYKTTNKLQNILDHKETIGTVINIKDLNNKKTMIETFDGILDILSYHNVMAKTGESTAKGGMTGGADQNLKDMFITCLHYLLFKRKLFLELNKDITDKNRNDIITLFTHLKTSEKLNTVMPEEVSDLVSHVLDIKYDYKKHIQEYIDHNISLTKNNFLYIRTNTFDDLIKRDIITAYTTRLSDSIDKIDIDKVFVQYIKEIVEKPKRKNVDNLYNIFHRSPIYTNEISDINNKKTKTEKEIKHLNYVIEKLSEVQEVQKEQKEGDTKETPLIMTELLEKITKNMKEKNENKKSNAEQLLQSKSKEITKEYIKKVLDFVDNNNAISAIGTLEFLDKMAKLDSVGLTTCNYDEIGHDKEILTDKYEYKKQWKVDYENDFKFSSLYQKKTGGKKTSKSLKQKKKPVNQTKKREKH